MDEAQAQAWLASHGWWGGAEGERLRAYVALLLAEADRQNLISASSRDAIWARHIVDSAQLLPLARGHAGTWVDLGSGAGLPGLVVACLRPAPTILVEVRPLRADFLRRCAEVLDLPHVEVRCEKVERVTQSRPAGVISARAYAPMERLIASAAHLADSSTIWLLPKGRNAQKELAIARRDWQARFHVEQSATDPESAIVTIQTLQSSAKTRAKTR